MNVGATVAAFLLPVVALGYVAHQSYKRRDSLGGRYLLYFVASNLLWLCGYAIQLNVQTVQQSVFWAQIEFIGVATSPVFFLLFALRYTQGYSLTDRQELALLAVPVLTIGFVWTNPLHQLMWSEYGLRTWYGLSLTTRTFGPWYFVHGVYSYLTFLAGVVVFVVLLAGRNFLFRRQAITILVGTVVPVVLSLPFVLGLSPVEGLDLTPFAFAITGVAFWYAFVDTEFYDIVPAIKTVGWASVADEIDSGILVTDTRTKIIEANHTACLMFNKEREEIIGRPITALFGPEDTMTEVASGYDVHRTDGSVYQVQSSSVRTNPGDRLGFIFTIVDVTQRRRRSQQLQVLNRVLRHNLRNKATVVRGNAEQITALTERSAVETDEIATLAASITDASERLSEMSNIAGAVDGLIEETTTHGQSLGRVVDASLTAIRQNHDDVAIEADVDEELVVNASDRLEQAITQVLRNAIEHNPSGTRIEIEANATDDTVELVITDDGQGIPEHELEPIESGAETPLEHGSGLGLWFIRWTVEASGGTIDIQTDDSGTVVRLSLPRNDGPAA